MHRLLTFPPLYRLEAHETIPDLTVDMRASMHGDDILIVVELPSRTETFSAPLIETLASFGESYRQLLVELARERRDIVEHSLFMAHLPDGFALSQQILLPD
jgi:hypothetical protein